MTETNAPRSDARPLSPTPCPIGRLGPIEVASDGTLKPSAAESPPRFGFRWQGRRIAATLVDGLKVEFSVLAGYVPFTAENPSARPRVLAAVTALRDGLPTGWRLRLSPDHAVHLEADATLGRPATISGLLTEATRFILSISPCIALLEEEGARAG